MNEKNSKDSSFSGQLGFVLAAAASAVGVGNLWREGWRRNFPADVFDSACDLWLRTSVFGLGYRP